MPFAALVYAKGAKVTLVHDHLINYRAEEGMNSSTIRTDGRLKMMPIQCGIAKQYFKENNCWEEVKEVAYKHFYNCSFGMWRQTDLEFKKAHFDELYKLFKDIPNENVKMVYFKDKEKKVMNLIIANNYNKLLKKYEIYLYGLFKVLRRKVIQIHLNKKDCYIKVLGKILFKK